MTGKNSQIHSYLETQRYTELKEEAKKHNLTLSELIRRKLDNSPISEEILLIKKLRFLLTNKSKKRRIK